MAECVESAFYDVILYFLMPRWRLLPNQRINNGSPKPVHLIQRIIKTKVAHLQPEGVLPIGLWIPWRLGTSRCHSLWFMFTQDEQLCFYFLRNAIQYIVSNLFHTNTLVPRVQKLTEERYCFTSPLCKFKLLSFLLSHVAPQSGVNNAA